MGRSAAVLLISSAAVLLLMTSAGAVLTAGISGLPAEMGRSAAVLLLMTSAGAVQYRREAAVSLPGPAVSASPAVSETVCAVLCEALLSEGCAGLSYAAGDGTCRLFSGDCRGPASDSLQQATGRYLSRNHCPGKVQR